MGVRQAGTEEGGAHRVTAQRQCSGHSAKPGPQPSIAHPEQHRGHVSGGSLPRRAPGEDPGPVHQGSSHETHPHHCCTHRQEHRRHQGCPGLESVQSTLCVPQHQHSREQSHTDDPGTGSAEHQDDEQDRQHRNRDPSAPAVQEGLNHGADPQQVDDVDRRRPAQPGRDPPPVVVAGVVLPDDVARRGEGEHHRGTPQGTQQTTARNGRHQGERDQHRQGRLHQWHGEEPAWRMGDHRVVDAHGVIVEPQAHCRHGDDDQERTDGDTQPSPVPDHRTSGVDIQHAPPCQVHHQQHPECDAQHQLEDGQALPVTHRAFRRHEGGGDDESCQDALGHHASDPRPQAPLVGVPLGHQTANHVHVVTSLSGCSSKPVVGLLAVGFATCGTGPTVSRRQAHPQLFGYRRAPVRVNRLS